MLCIRTQATVSDLVQYCLELPPAQAENSEYLLRRMTITVRDESKATQDRLRMAPASQAVDAAWADIAMAGSCSPALKELIDPLIGEGVAHMKKA